MRRWSAAYIEVHSADGRTKIVRAERGLWQVYVRGSWVATFKLRREARVFIRLRKGS